MTRWGVFTDVSASSADLEARLAALAAATGASLGVLNVLDSTFGAVGNGTADDYTAFHDANEAAHAAGGGVIFLPPGKTFKTDSTVDLYEDVSVWIPAGATVKAGAAMQAIFRTPLSTVAKNRSIFGQGTIDGNFLADIGIHPRYFARFTIEGLTVMNTLVAKLKLGESGMPSTSYEGMIRGVKGDRTTGNTNPDGSKGLWIAYASDCKTLQSVFTADQTGVRVDTSNNDFTQVHAWSYTPSTGDMECCFDDNGFSNRWVQAYADSPSASASRIADDGIIPYGFRFRQDPGAVLIAPVCYLNNLNGVDNVASAFRFDTAAPFATIVGRSVKGADITHRWAKDIDINGGDDSNLNLSGLESANIVNSSSPDRTRQTFRAAGDMSCLRLQIPTSTGTNVTGFALYTPTLTPASVGAATVAEQTFTVNGLTTKDIVTVNPPSIATATGIAGARVSAANTLAIRFTNPTAGALTPTSGTYTVFAIRTP